MIFRDRSPVAIERRWTAHRLRLATTFLFFLPAVAFAGTFPVKLNGPLVAGGDVSTRTISPDNTTVVYRADQDTDGVFELYSVPIGGGTAVKLNVALSSNNSDVNTFQITPDSSTVVYTADPTQGADQLFTVPITGGASTRLDESENPDGRVSDFSISPDGTKVVYLGDLITDEVTELFSVPISGGSVTKLSLPSTTTREVLFTRLISSDSSTVVYIGDHNVNNVNELFSVPIDGGTVTQLNPALPPGGSTGLFGFAISPDGSRVVYSADQETNNVHEIFSVPIGGGPSVKLNGTLPANGAIFQFQITPDSTSVIYRGDEVTGGIDELFQVPIAGGTSTRISTPGVHAFNYAISADSSTVVYQTSTGGQGLEELFSVPVAGGTVTQLNAPVPVGETVASFEVSNDGSTVIYSTGFIDADEAPNTALFSVPIGGGTPIKLTPEFPTGSGPSGGDISPDSSFVVYEADKDTPGVRELYGVSINGGPSTKLNGPLVMGGDAGSVRFSSDSNWILYLADQETDEVDELYSLPREALTPPVVFIFSNDSSSAETGANDATFTVARTANNTSGPLTVKFDLTGSAALNTDYTLSPALPTTVTIAAGQVSTDVAVQPLADNLLEGAEQLTITLLPDTAAYVLGDDISVDIAIQDDPVNLNIFSEDDYASEIDLNTASFTVSRSGGDLTTSISIDLDIGGSATPGDDYTLSSVLASAVTIPANETSATVIVTPKVDAGDVPGDEGEETIVITIQDPGYLVAPPGVTTLIIDDTVEIFSDGFEPPTVFLSCFRELALTDPNRFVDEGESVFDLMTGLTWNSCGKAAEFDWPTGLCWPVVEARALKVDHSTDDPNVWREATVLERSTLPDCAADPLVR